ncbi:uncharacterized protein LOC114535436 [Dendronephthya gigantea]|uniref:uncharacterized protein LOC114535436 n=1 Tax=Dendronephthya gigantea TaxID=151771 RepID=UPI00106D4B98|nr:uncharacterized protein LOC114535436 [Dendronephthya gigantea]
MVYLEIDPLSLCNNNTSTSVSGVPLNALQIEKLHRALKSRFPTHIGQCAMSIKEIKQACQEILLKELDEQCKELCLRKNPSVLRNNGFDDIVKFDWLNIVYELQKRCPFLLSVLNTVTAKKKTQSELAPCIGMAYAILMIQRNHELSLVQRINTLIMAEGNAKKQLYTRCQKVGFALSHQSKVNLLDEIGGHFADEAITMVKNGCKMQGTGDNWDFRILCHDMRKDHQNKDMHYFASNLLFERVPIPDNLSLSPKHDIKTLENSSFLLSVAESKKLLEDYKVIISRILVQYLPAFGAFKTIVPTHIDHVYQDEMSKQSVIVPLPIQMKDEKSYADTVDILSSYEDAIEDIYSRAGVIQKPKKDNQIILLKTAFHLGIHDQSNLELMLQRRTTQIICKAYQFHLVVTN